MAVLELKSSTAMLCYAMLIYSVFLPWCFMMLGIMLSWWSPFPNAEESHVKAKLGEGIHNSPHFPCHLVPRALFSPHGLLPVQTWSCPPPGGAVSPQMAAPSSDATGRTGRDTCLQVTVEGGRGPEGGSWVPELPPTRDLLTCGL